jgi:hypothetical protein
MHRAAISSWLRAGGLALALAACGGGDDPDTGPGGDLAVSAGDDLVVAWPTTRAALRGSAEGGLPVAWTVESGPAGAIDAVVRAAPDGQPWVLALRPGGYVLRAEARDGDRLGWDTVRVEVVDDTDPRSALDHVEARPAPVFRAGHRLPPLTRWTGMHDLAFQVAMTERYFYALDLGDTGDYWAGDGLATVREKLARKAQDPARYPVSLSVHRPLIYDAAFRARLEADYPDVYLRDAAGALVDGARRWSPLAPTAASQRMADVSIANLDVLLAAADELGIGEPQVDVILNGGEYALGVWGDTDAPWSLDPDVAAAMGDTDAEKFAFLSANKARQEQVITDAHVARVPGAMYVYYPTQSAGWRQRWGGWWRFTWDYPAVRALTQPSTLAATSIYYRDFPSQNTGWDGDKDSLTQLLNSQAWQQQQGAPHQYLSTCAGWPHGDRPLDELLADLEVYTGYLKVAYVAGMLGGIAGYFANPGWGDELAPLPDPATMPHWLGQLVALGEVHALFSHLEDELRDGELLPGPRAHRWSADQPAYEFDALVDGVADPGVRVTARRHAASGTTLVAAWAWDGADRDVTVDLGDGRGPLALRARRAGAVYAVDEAGAAALLDHDGLHPTDTRFPDE